MEKITYPRTIVLDNEELKDLIEKKNAVLEEGRELSKQIDVLENERNKKGLKIQKLKDKLIPLAQELAKPLLLNKYEDLETIDLDPETGKPTVNVFNHLEMWTENFDKNLAAVQAQKDGIETKPDAE